MILRISILLQSALYTGAGFLHWLYPRPYLAIVPPWVPLPHLAVAATGLWEVVAGLALLPKKTRKAAAVSIILLLIVVFPANVQMALNDYRNGSQRLPLTLLRLPLQPLLIFWAYSVMQSKPS